MQVFDEIKNQMVDVGTTRKVVVHQLKNNLIFGYVSEEATVVDADLFLESGWLSQPVSYDLMRENLFYSTSRGKLTSKVNLNARQYVQEHYGMRKMAGDRSVYSFTRHDSPVYEAVNRFDIFKGRQQILDSSTTFKLSEFMPYTFGLEFETSQGCVPEPLCFRDGLIPLRDGSISGYEYSTVVLQGNQGLQLLKQQIDTLKEYTAFDKECSLHVHIGGYPQNANYIFRVYYLCVCLESYIATLVPPLTFRTSRYKANEKDYCKPLRAYESFDDLYYGMTGSRFFGSLTQAHPQDIERKRKWQINARYHWCNVINAICYNVNKTIEFRFLRPTYNYKKIVLWLYIFNAIMKYAEKNTHYESYSTDLMDIIRDVYPEDIAYELDKGIALLGVLRESQINNNDECGQQVHLEDRLFEHELDI